MSIFASYARLSSRYSNITHHNINYLIAMKSGIHPTYFEKATVTCSCGAVFETGSTVENMKTEICSQCHPFYTGKKKFIDVTGRVDRFKKLAEKSAAKKTAHLKTVKAKTESKKTSEKSASAKVSAGKKEKEASDK